MQIQHILERENEIREKSFTISQVARLTGVNAKAIRYYESVGLLPRPARFTNQYRRYSFTDVNRLILLRRIRHLGVPLVQAKELLSDVSGAQCLEVREELLRLVNTRLVALDQEIAELHRMRDDIESYQDALSRCHPTEGEAFANCVDMSCIAVLDEDYQKGVQVC